MYRARVAGAGLGHRGDELDLGLMVPWPTTVTKPKAPKVAFVGAV